MNRRRLRQPLAVLLLLALAACGAGTATPTGQSISNGNDPTDPVGTGAPTDDAEPTEGLDDEFVDEFALPPGTPAACDLLTADEVASVLGHPVEPDAWSESNCVWWPADGEDGLNASISMAPLPEQDCVEFHDALGATDLFEYEDAEVGVPAFQQYSETLGETHVATVELCTPEINVGVRVEGQEPDEATHTAMVADLVPLVLDRLEAALRQ